MSYHAAHRVMQHYEETPLGEDDHEVAVTRGFVLPQAQLRREALVLSADPG
jgi:hypothetical protein